MRTNLSQVQPGPVTFHPREYIHVKVVILVIVFYRHVEQTEVDGVDPGD